MTHLELLVQPTARARCATSTPRYASSVVLIVLVVDDKHIISRGRRLGLTSPATHVRGFVPTSASHEPPRRHTSSDATFSSQLQLGTLTQRKSSAPTFLHARKVCHQQEEAAARRAASPLASHVNDSLPGRASFLNMALNLFGRVCVSAVLAILATAAAASRPHIMLIVADDVSALPPAAASFHPGQVAV